jgi:hypothetical protein
LDERRNNQPATKQTRKRRNKKKDMHVCIDDSNSKITPMTNFSFRTNHATDCIFQNKTTTDSISGKRQLNPTTTVH